MTNLITAIKKLSTRTRRNGYYEASDLLTSKEKSTILTLTASIMIPLLISVAIVFVG